MKISSYNLTKFYINLSQCGALETAFSTEGGLRKAERTLGMNNHSFAISSEWLGHSNIFSPPGFLLFIILLCAITLTFLHSWIPLECWPHGNYKPFYYSVNADNILYLFLE